MPPKAHKRARHPATGTGTGTALSFEQIMAKKEAGALDECATLLQAAHSSTGAVSEGVSEGDSNMRAQAGYELALLYCQRGEPERADEYLRELGYRFRLNRRLWQGVSEGVSEGVSVSGGREGVVRCFDEVLPGEVLQRLQGVFSSESPFWAEHEYPTDSFFSYNVPLAAAAPGGSKKKKEKKKEKSPCVNLMTQIAQYLQPLVAEAFPDMDISSVASIEWWAHTRSTGASAGHRVSTQTAINILFHHFTAATHIKTENHICFA